jgi:hypothetical protein
MKKLGALILTLAFAQLSEAATQAPGTADRGVAFQRVAEPRESAFTILVPRGWSASGGIFRINAAQAGGPLNAIEAKCDLTFQSDERGTVRFRILPDVVFAHQGIGAGYWPPGSSYQGATVRPVEDAVTFLRTAFRQLNPRASEAKVVKISRLPGEIESLERGMAFTNTLLAGIGGAAMTARFDAAGAVFEYKEDGTRYREAIVTGVVDTPAALTWKNTRMLAFRARADIFDRWRPVMDVMRFSVRFNPKWVLKEAEGQQQRADFVLKVHDEIRRIDREILRKTRINREEIMNDNFLVLTGQEEYVNTHTGEVEVDTNAFRYRWTTSGGDRYYTNREEVDPNTFLQRTDYERTPVRKRRNE